MDEGPRLIPKMPEKSAKKITVDNKIEVSALRARKTSAADDNITTISRGCFAGNIFVTMSPAARSAVITHWIYIAFAETRLAHLKAP